MLYYNLFFNFILYYCRIVQCEGILLVFGLWLNSVEPDKLCDSLLIEKILEILSRLQFTVDLLVKHKFGRIIKKITQQQVKTQSKNKTPNYELAVKLFEEWSVLANKSEISVTARRKSDDENLVTDTKTMEEPLESQSSLKRFSPEIISNDIDVDAKKIKAIKKKSVSFPESEAKLCKIIIFERAPEEYEFLSDGSAARDNYLHGDEGEAFLAFKSHKDYDEYDLKPWTNLKPIDDLPDIERPEGGDSEEKIIQQQRERTVLCLNYYSMSEIPEYPSENDVDDISDDSFTGKIISIRANETISKQFVSIKTNLPPPSLVVPSELLTNFMTSTLNPFAAEMNNNTSTCSSYNPFFDDTPYVPSKHDKPSKYYNESRHKRDILNNRRRHLDGADGSSPGQQGYSSRSVCRYYKAGKKSSCRLGSSCKFLHQN